MEQWFAPVVPSLPPIAKSVLVLAPHPDDEIFGCGGLLALYGKSSAEIQVQVLTDGAGYHPQSRRESVFETRKQETNQALAALGLNPAVFSGYADRSLAACADLAGVVQEIIQQQAADVVLAPSLWEIHPDHLATARAALAAIHGLWRAGKKVPTLTKYFYNTAYYNTSARYNTLLTKVQLMPMLRLSELYLIAIESTDDLAQANSLYKTYMQSHNVNITDDFKSLNAVKEELEYEYTREFYGEGQTFYAYKRWGVTWMLFGTAPMKEAQYVLPLPNTEFDPNAASSGSSSTTK